MSGVRERGRKVRGPEGYPYIPPGYRLDESDPDILILRRKDGTAIAHFSPQGATREAIEQAAREDHETREENQQ